MISGLSEALKNLRFLGLDLLEMCSASKAQVLKTEERTLVSSEDPGDPRPFLGHVTQRGQKPPPSGFRPSRSLRAAGSEPPPGLLGGRAVDASPCTAFLGLVLAPECYCPPRSFR